LYCVVEEVARIDGSTGWCAFIGAVGTSFGAFLPDAAVEEICGHASGIPIAGALFPPGTANVCKGGYLVNGRWSYASGCPYSTWLVEGRLVFENGEKRLVNGFPEMRIAYVPRNKGTIIGESGQVSGLASTGSNDFTLEEVFVAEEDSHRLGPGTPRGKHFQSPLYTTYPLISAFAFPMGAVALVQDQAVS
jgi:alkylation response protein AidB-like acyl-CoA dehydrogenase